MHTLLARVFLPLLIIFTMGGCAITTEKGTFHEHQGVYALVEPTDLALYRSLLPKEFSMPAQPMVAFYLIDIKDVAWPLSPYLESAIFLKSKFGNQEGWYVKHMAVNKWLPMKAGRYMGFPKYVADEIIFRETVTGWHGEVNHAGMHKLTVEFLRGELADVPESKKDFVVKTLATIGTSQAFHTMVPPEEGPTVQKVWTDHVVSPKWSTPQLGLVRISIDPNEPLARLISPQVTSIGFTSRFVGGLNMVSEKLN